MEAAIRSLLAIVCCIGGVSIANAADFKPTIVKNQVEASIGALTVLSVQANAISAEAFQCVEARKKAISSDLEAYSKLVEKSGVPTRAKAQVGSRLIARSGQAVSEAEQCLVTVDMDTVGRLAFGLATRSILLSKISSASDL